MLSSALTKLHDQSPSYIVCIRFGPCFLGPTTVVVVVVQARHPNSRGPSEL